MPERKGAHRVAPDLVRRARRMGPLPWSALGATPAPGPVAGHDLTPWLAACLDRLWSQLGHPDPYVVVEAGAGDGRRVAAVLASRPACLRALRWLLVDDEPGAEIAQRVTLQRGGAPGAHGAPGRAGPGGLALEDPSLVLGPVAAADDPDEGPVSPPGIGPLLASLRDLPGGLPLAVVLAVGWLGRLPSDLFEWRDGRWWEVRLAAGAGPDTLEELLVEAGDRAPLAAGAADGDRVGDPASARRWLASARRVAAAGRVVAVDLFSPDRLPLDRLGAPPREREVLPPLLVAQWDMRD